MKPSKKIRLHEVRASAQRMAKGLNQLDPSTPMTVASGALLFEMLDRTITIILEEDR